MWPRRRGFSLNAGQPRRRWGSSSARPFSLGYCVTLLCRAPPMFSLVFTNTRRTVDTATKENRRKLRIRSRCDPPFFSGGKSAKQPAQVHKAGICGTGFPFCTLACTGARARAAEVSAEKGNWPIFDNLRKQDFVTVFLIFALERQVHAL